MIHVFVFAQGQTQALANAFVIIQGVMKQVDAATRKASFDLPVPGTYTITGAASGYQTKTADYPVTAAANVVFVTLAPIPPPQPAPAVESEIGSVGVCCVILKKTEHGWDWYRYKNTCTGKLSSWYQAESFARYDASADTGCFTAPPAVPNVIEQISNKIDSSTGTTTKNIDTLGAVLGDMIANTTSGISDKMSAGQIALEGLGHATRQRVDEVYSLLGSMPGLVSAKMNDMRDSLNKISAWQTGFVWPDFGNLLKTHVVDKLDAWFSAYLGIPAKASLWGELMHRLDVWISGLFGVDPTLPFFDALWARQKTKLDTYISGLFGVDAAKPFWPELEKKIVALAVKSIDAVLDVIIPEPPKEK